MRIIDISVPISETMPVWPGDAPVEIIQTSNMEKGDKNTLSQLKFGVHTGTHVDAPKHFLLGGNGIEALDLQVLTGSALVVDTGDVASLTRNVLETLRIPTSAERLLFRTRNSELWKKGMKAFEEDFVAITEDGAQWLVDRGVKLVGVDYLSVAPFGHSVPTHVTLLKAGIIPVEGLNLTDVTPGIYFLICLPLKIVGSDGAPARVVLIENMESSSL